jgi:hypothetical protein
LIATDASVLNCDSDNRHRVEIYRTVLFGNYRADMNCDGIVSFEDIPLFVDCLVSGNCGCP